MKVFCIGFNKTGTASLHSYFEQAGLASSHDAAYQTYTRTMEEADLRAYLDAHDAFSDGERADFARLVRLYPDAKFILNTRGLRSWLESRVKHVFRREGAALARPADVHSDPRPGTWSGPMAREYLHDPERAISDWIDRREFYHRSVLGFFATSKQDFLKLNVTEDPRWQSRLGSFLGAMPHRPGNPQIHANAATADTSVPGMAERLRQVERVLGQKNIPRAEWACDTHVGFGARTPA